MYCPPVAIILPSASREPTIVILYTFIGKIGGGKWGQQGRWCCGEGAADRGKAQGVDQGLNPVFCCLDFEATILVAQVSESPDYNQKTRFVTFSGFCEFCCLCVYSIAYSSVAPEGNILMN